MRWLSFGCLAVAAAVAAGCGGDGSTIPVNGVVTLDDKPLSGARVTFYPEKETGGLGGTAETGSDGKFVIVGAKGAPGLVPGKYRVTVSKGQIKGGIDGGGGEEQVGAIIPEIDLKDEFPPIYSHPGQTILAYSVTGDGKPIEIKLDSKRKK
jgi:hypothetical protein